MDSTGINLLLLILHFNIVSTKVHCENSKVERNNIEYHPSSGVNLILGVPHGGWRESANIPDRDFGCTSEDDECIWKHDCGYKSTHRCRAIVESDFNTYDLAMKVRLNMCHMFGGSCPAVVINLLNRTKFDANRNLSEATFHVEEAVQAFNTFHEFIDKEKQKIHVEVGGLFVDIHGQNHPIVRAELGYLLKNEEFEEDLRISLLKSSIRNLALKTSNRTEDLEAILRGNKSLGWFLEANEYAAVPSPTYETPRNDPYFSGGYNTFRHGSLNGGSVDGIQIESARRVRENDRISEYSCALSRALKEFICVNYYSTSAHDSISDVIRQSCHTPFLETDCVNQ